MSASSPSARHARVDTLNLALLDSAKDGGAMPTMQKSGGAIASPAPPTMPPLETMLDRLSLNEVPSAFKAHQESIELPPISPSAWEVFV